MPQAGYKAVTIKETSYDMARQQAVRDGVSISETISKAVQRYVNRKQEFEERVRDVLRAMDETEGAD